MCGICGFWNRDRVNLESLDKKIKTMTGVFSDRGPDNQGFWIEGRNSIAFGHTRLSIQDLSNTGSQPMISKSGRFVVIFNGEIYNHNNLRSNFENDLNHNWKGSSDTETLVNLIDKYGLEKTLSMIEGMFALAVWDDEKRQLYIARDRIGEKPLYYGFHNDAFYFFSDLRPLYELKNEQYAFDHEAFNFYKILGYIPAPYSIFKNFKKLIPGKFASVSLNENFEFNEYDYWKLSDTFRIQENSLDEVELSRKLIRSVESQLISDKEVGAFLSGGIDSSLICAILKRELGITPHTFSVSLNNRVYNEGIYAKEVAEFLGTNHHNYHLSSKEMALTAEKMSDVYSEPFADSSQIPTYLLSKFAKNEVSVCLSGDGGDELFAGYNRHKYLRLITVLQKYLPRKTFGILANVLKNINSNKLDHFFLFIFKFLPDKYTFSYPANKLEKLTRLSNFENLSQAYANILSGKMIGKYDHLVDLISSYDESNNLNIDSLNKILFFDQSLYLPDDILTKVDRAAMASSLEVRAPFLSKEIIEKANALPADEKINNETKYPLRKILENYIPKKMINRPKMGFSIPLGDLLREDLKKWANDLLSKEKLAHYDFFDHVYVNKIWREHLKSEYDHSKEIWNILMFQVWFFQYEKFIKLS